MRTEGGPGYSPAGDFAFYNDGVLRLTVSDSEIAYGRVAFGGTESPEFDNVKIGYDNNGDGDIADAGDDPSGRSLRAHFLRAGRGSVASLAACFTRGDPLPFVPIASGLTVWNEDFASTSKSVSYDHAGNLVDDGDFVYIYDAPAHDTQHFAARRCCFAARRAGLAHRLPSKIKKTVIHSGQFNC